MKKILIFLLVSVFGFSLAACSSKGGTAGENAESGAAGPDRAHTIGVLVYSYADDEVVSFRNYLQQYIAENFDVDFFYSQSITTQEEEMAFLQEAADYGAEGIMSFRSFDVAAEADLCAENGVYYMLASGTVPDEQFAAAEDNEYFVGVVGPGSFIEYKAGSDMASYFVNLVEGDEYFILSGGAPFGNEMHLQRTQGILDTLQTAYQVKFDRTSEEIALSEEPVHLEAGDLKVCVCPGYISRDEYLESAKQEYARDQYGIVMSVLGISGMIDEIRGAHLGSVDCYSQTNQQLFASGRMEYLVGKYSSIIGPSFAAMYNAVTGHIGELRDHGKAFHITQGFWSSESAKDFDKKYGLASSIELNAYNYEDLQQVIMDYNEDATLDDLRALAEAYTYKDASERRDYH